MPTVVLCTPPILQFFNNLGQPNVGGTVLTQVGGVNAATYQDSAGATPLPNPIPLNSRGEISNAVGATCQLFLLSNSIYTFTIFDAAGNQVDQATYVGGSTASGSLGVATPEWTLSALAPSYISGTSFSFAGNQTTAFTAGLRLKCTVTAGTVYGTILTSVFTTLTTITLEMDSGQALDAGLSAVSSGILNTIHPSLPPYLETMPIAVDHTDPTKRIKLSATEIPTGTTQTLAVAAAGIIEGVSGAAIASAATVNLDTATGDYDNITGTVTTTAITLTQGRERTVVANAAWPITAGASLIMTGVVASGNTYTCTAGDVFKFRGEAAGVVRCVSSAFSVRSAAVRGSLILLGKAAASGATTLVLPSSIITSTYDEYELHLVGIKVDTINVDVVLQISQDNGATWKTAANYAYMLTQVNSNNTSSIVGSGVSIGMNVTLGTNLSNAAASSLNGVVKLFTPSSTTLAKMFSVSTQYQQAANYVTTDGGGSYYNDTNAYTAVRLFVTTGNITAGNARLYGVRNS